MSARVSHHDGETLVDRHTPGAAFRVYCTSRMDHSTAGITCYSISEFIDVFLAQQNVRSPCRVSAPVVPRELVTQILLVVGELPGQGEILPLVSGDAETARGG